MEKLMNNYRVLFALRILKSIIATFLDTFLVLYFLQVSDNNILPLGIYKLISILVIYIVIFMVRNICKTKKRTNLMRIGIVLEFIYFLTLIILKEQMVEHIYLMGILYGLKEGFYYSVFNMIETDGVENKDRTKFVGTVKMWQNIFAIVLPTIFGAVIQNAGFINTLLIVLSITMLQIYLSLMFEDKNIPKQKKADLKGFNSIVKDEPSLKQVFKINFWHGLVYTEGAFKIITTIYIIKVFATSVSLGVFTSIFSLIAAAIGLFFAKKLKSKYYNTVMNLSTILMLICLLLMIHDCNMTTIVFFNLFQTISKEIIELVNHKNTSNIANMEKIKKEYKVEYFLLQETGIVAGRIIGQTLFILMAFTTSNIIIYIFLLFAWMYTLSSTKLQTLVERNK